uniref:Uncharacterized protein n=1 Tax=Meloidogyne enterolobii TaxID=390850 RepID=A0A6V7VAZ9_MELEN|nr:unnamed protein product [Meloidogyne enterolobii]
MFSSSLILIIQFLQLIFASKNIFSDITTSLNTKLDPCKDFYKFVCDGFEKRIKVSECYEISNAATRKAEVDDQLELILKTTKSPPPNLSKGLKQLFQKMFEFHHSCMSWSGKELFGSNAVLNKLELLHTDGKMKRPQFNTEWGIKAFPVGGFFQLVTIFDTRKGRTNLERKIVGVRPMSLISSQSDWNSNGNGNKLMATRFGQIINSLLEDDIVRSHQYNVNPVLFPFSNYILKGEIPLSCSKTKCPMSERLKQMVKSEAERRVKNLLLVEQMLAQHFELLVLERKFLTQTLSTKMTLCHIKIIFNYHNLTSLGNFYTHLIGPIILRSILSPINYKINWRTEIYVSEVGLLQRLAKTIEKLTDQQIADYLDWQILWTFLPQLDTRYTHPYVDVNKMKDSFSVKKCPMDRRWMKMGEKCKKFIEWYFPHFLDHLYIKKYLGKGVKEQVKQIFTDIYAAFKQMLETNSWLDLKAKQNALIKLKGIRSVSAYFDQIFNDNYLQQIYKPFYLLKTDALFPQIVYQLTGLSLLRQMATLDYYDPSWGVNAYYSRENNALVTLNAYLQPPIFNHDFPAPFNYAGIGVTLGHELTHAFDAWGSYYDAEGKYNNDWLLPDIRRKFQERKQCFVKQYGDIKVQVDGTLLSINGSLTANENIADNGGLIAAFNAFQLLKQKHNYPKHVFNGLRQYNEEQLFFIHYAYRQCSKMGQIWLRQRLSVGQHSVTPARVNVPLQNFPKFAKAFKCPLGSAMNPYLKCSLW